MTNFEKMNELVGTKATKEEIKNWAFHNRIHVICLHIEEEKFSKMKNSVEHFVNSDLFDDDEHKNWDRFLDSEYVE